MFGKSVSQYLAFQKVFLVAATVVGLTRLMLSLSGFPDTTVRWLSINVVLFAGLFYYGVAVYKTGFGSYKQLLPLAFFQVLPLHAFAVCGILLSIAGHPNIYAAPEFSPPGGVQAQWLHLLSHLTIGMVAAPLVGWGIASLVMLVTKKTARRPALA